MTRSHCRSPPHHHRFGLSAWLQAKRLPRASLARGLGRSREQDLKGCGAEDKPIPVLDLHPLGNRLAVEAHRGRVDRLYVDGCVARKEPGGTGRETLAANANRLRVVAADRAVGPVMEPVATDDLPGGLENELLKLWQRGISKGQVFQFANGKAGPDRYAKGRHKLAKTAIIAALGSAIALFDSRAPIPDRHLPSRPALPLRTLLAPSFQR